MPASAPPGGGVGAGAGGGGPPNENAGSGSWRGGGAGEGGGGAGRGGGGAGAPSPIMVGWARFFRTGPELGTGAGEIAKESGKKEQERKQREQEVIRELGTTVENIVFVGANPNSGKKVL